MIDDLNYNVRKLIRTVMAMPENSVRPAKQGVPSGGQMDEIATVDVLESPDLGWPAFTYENADDTNASPVNENVDQLKRAVVSVNFYRRPPTSGYLRGFTVSAVVAGYVAIVDGGFDMAIDGVNRQISLLDFSGAASMAAVAAIVQTRLQVALAATSCAWDAANARFVVTSPTTGQTSAVAGAVAPTAPTLPDPPTDVSAVLGMTIGGGAISVNNRAGIARYSNAAFDRASGIAQRLRRSSSVALMASLGLAFVGASTPRNLAALVDGDAWESRGQVDLTFYVVNRETSQLPSVGSGSVTLTVDSKTKHVEVTT